MKKYKREADYQSDLMDTIQERFPGAYVMKNDSSCFHKIISSGIAIGVIGELAVENKNSVVLEPLDVIDFKYEQPVCMYYKKESAYGNIARFISFIRDNNHNKELHV